MTATTLEKPLIDLGAWNVFDQTRADAGDLRDQRLREAFQEMKRAEAAAMQAFLDAEAAIIAEYDTTVEQAKKVMENGS